MPYVIFYELEGKNVILLQDLKFQKCVALNLAYVETLSSYNEMTIDNTTMKFVIVVYGSVIDTRTEAPYLAPCILPKTCEQVRRIISKVICDSWCPQSD